MKSKNKAYAIVVILLAFLAFTNVIPTHSRTEPKPAFVPNVLLLEVKPGVTLRPDLKGKAGHKFQTNSSALDKALGSLGVQSLKPVFPSGQAKKAEQRSGGTISLSRLYRLKLNPNTDIEAAVASLSSNPDVSFAEPDYIAVRADLPTIDDPLYSAQWGMAKIDIENAWDDTFGSPTVTIAILDSGIDLTHVDLAGNLWLNPGEVAGNGLDDDSNGLIDDTQGWNFVSTNNDVADENGHGTLVAGVAAAIAGNGQGIAGVCPQCRIMPVKVMSMAGTANYSDVAAGVLYAAGKGAKVINISLGGYANSNMLNNAINTAVNTYGAVVVAGAGNDNLNQLFYPAAYDNVLAVAGTANDDTKVGTSNYGTWVDVSAPGIDIKTTALGGGWADNSGTSFSAPFVAGVAGLLRTLHPTWNQATIRSQIIHTTDNIEGLNPSYSGLLGSGRLNAGASMQAPHPMLSMTGYAVNGTANGRPVLGTSSNLVITLSNDWWNATGVSGTLSTTDSYITLTNGSASFGDIPAATSKSNSTPFKFSVAAGAGYNHPIPFKLHVTDTTGYETDIDFTITTESGVVNKSGTITADETWTNDKTYLIIANVGVAPGVTLTIQPGTTVKFNGNFTLNVGGTLIADGTSEQPIQFKFNTSGTWDKILFSDTSADATADGSGEYVSGSILRYVNIQGANAGIACTTSTPYLSHVLLNSGGINCSLGTTDLWFLDNNITGNVTITGPATAYRNTVSGNLSISGAGEAEDNDVSGTLSLGSGSAKRNDVGGLSIGGSGGTLENNTVSGGNVALGDSFHVTGNTINGSLTTGNGATVDHNTVSNGISVGDSSIVTWNNVEGASGMGLAAGSDVTAQYNRLIGNTTGMTASSGSIEHNLIANNSGAGLQVNGDAAITNNTFTGNQGNTIVISSGAPVIHGNNLDLNTGTYDIQNDGPSPIDASGNWWGTTDSATIDARIFDYFDDFNKGTITYLLTLTEPNQAAPAYVRTVTVLPDTTLGIQTGIFETQFSKPMDTNNSVSMAFYSTKNPWSRYTKSNSDLPDNLIYSIAIEANRIKWFGTYGTGVARFDGTHWTVYNKSNSGLPENYILAIAIEANGTKWFATNNGVTSFDGTKWTVYNTSNSDLPSNVVYAIAIEGNGAKWFGTSGGIARFDGTHWTVYNKSNSGLPDNVVRAIAIEENGTKWFGTDRYGVASFDETHWTVYNKSNSGLPGTYTATIAIESNGTKWFGSRGGAASFDGTHWMVYNTSNSRLPDDLVTAIAIETNGTKWFGTYYGGVARFDGTHWTVYSPDSGLPVDRVNAIAIEGNNTKWFGMLDMDGGVGGVGVLFSTRQYPIIDNPQWLSSSLSRATYDITSAIPKDTYRINLSNAIDPDGMRIAAPISNATFTVDYAGSITDKTPPLKPVVTATGNGGLTSLSASWTSSDPESPITKYRYAIGTTSGGRDVVAWTYVDNPSMTHTGLNLTAGVTYYVSAGARNEGGLWSATGVSNPVPAGVLPSSKTFRSVSTYDGWILESSETSNKGGTMDSKATTFNLGDNAAKKQYRAILSFNTALPANAAITKVTLKIRKQGQAGANPFTTLGNILVDIRKGAFSNNNILQIGDFQVAASKSSIGTIKNTPVSNWYSVDLLNTSFSFINKTGVTQLRLRFTKDDNNNAVADYLKFFSGNAPAASRPQLIIKYYVP